MSRHNNENSLPSKSPRITGMVTTRKVMQQSYSAVRQQEKRRVNRLIRNNAMIAGAGASTQQDRGSKQEMGWSSLNPFFDPNPLRRWMLWTRWYYTDWAAQKIVDIPVDDAFRKPFILKGITAEESKMLMKVYNELGGDKQFKRAMKQQRLLGGSVIYMPLADSPLQSNEARLTIADPVNFEALMRNPSQPGAAAPQYNIKGLNVIDMQRIWQTSYTIDFFSPDYDKPQSYNIGGYPVHIDRLIPFDGDPLFNRNIINIYMPWRANPSGFGESVLTPLHDLMVRVTGTQEGAYHLVNLSSVLLMKCKDLKGLNATKSGSNVVESLKEIVRNISIYRAALLEADDAEITQHAASFGSVPELVMTFLIILSAGGDIPATRFLGQAPGGLNATGESDLENYYDSIDSKQKNDITPRLKKLFKIIGCCIWGFEKWSAMEEKLEIVFPPLWNLSEKDEAEKNEIIARTLLSLYDGRIINDQQLFDELLAANIFNTDIEFDAQLAELREELLNKDNEQGEDGAFGGEGEKKEKPDEEGKKSKSKEKPE